MSTDEPEVTITVPAKALEAAINCLKDAAKELHDFARRTADRELASELRRHADRQDRCAEDLRLGRRPA